MGNHENTIGDEYQKIADKQEYNKPPKIDGVVAVDARHFVTEDGSFSEVMRFAEEGQLKTEGLPPFTIRQINYSETMTGTIKAWHFHLEQDEVWYVIPGDGPVIVGLLDLRKDSPTIGTSMRLILGGGKAKLLYIPRGVAHGIANHSGRNVGLIYLVSNQFDGTDERRLPPDTGVREDFWQIAKG